MKTSIDGICSILSHEAIVLQTYRDAVGVLTIGAGHTKAAGVPAPVPGMKISLVEALNIFNRDIQAYEADVNAAINVSLTQQQFDAIVSWHYNTGAVRTATLTKKLNRSDFEGAAKEFARWNKADGKILNGLVKRRKLETAIFTDGDYGNPILKIHQVHKDSPKRLKLNEIKDLLEDDGSLEEDQSTEQLLANPASRLLPNFRPKQTEETSLATFNQFIDLVPEDRHNDPVKILAVRGYYTNTLGEKGINDRNLYDDALFVIEPRGVHNFNGNTDPSKFRKGIAKLKAPQAVRYIPGPHGFKRKNGPYPAFRQDSVCTVERDGKGDDTGIFWINLHRGGNTTTSSAGCQTVPPHQWNEFKTLVDNLLKTHNQKTFYYILVEQAHVLDQDVVAKPKPTPKSKPPVIVRPPVPRPRPVIAAANQSEDTVGVLLLLLNQLRSRRGKPAIDRSALRPPEVGSLEAVNAANKPELKLEAVEPGKEKLTPVNAALGTTIGKALNGRKTGLGIIALLAAVLVPELNPELAELLGMEVASSGSTPEVNLAPATEQTTDNTVTQQQDLSDNIPAPTPANNPPADASQVAGSVNVWTPIASALTAWGVLGKIDKWVHALKNKP